MKKLSVPKLSINEANFPCQSDCFICIFQVGAPSLQDTYSYLYASLLILSNK